MGHHHTGLTATEQNVPQCVINLICQRPVFKMMVEEKVFVVSWLRGCGIAGSSTGHNGDNVHHVFGSTRTAQHKAAVRPGSHRSCNRLWAGGLYGSSLVYP